MFGNISNAGNFSNSEVIQLSSVILVMPKMVPKKLRIWTLLTQCL